MFVSATTMAALDRITQRESDVNMAFTPGAVPAHDDVATDRNTSQASLDPLSVAAPDNAFFITTDARGRICYTRDGAFELGNSTLLNTNARPVLGYGASGALTELHVDAIDQALHRVTNLHVEPDGALVYLRASVDPRSGKREATRVQVGRIALARFSAATKLTPLDANQFLAPTGVAPHVGQPGDGNFAKLTPMRRESSRVDFDASLERLSEAYRAFDAAQAAHTAQGNASKTIMDLVK